MKQIHYGHVRQHNVFQHDGGCGARQWRNVFFYYGLGWGWGGIVEWFSQLPVLGWLCVWFVVDQQMLAAQSPIGPSQETIVKLGSCTQMCEHIFMTMIVTSLNCDSIIIIINIAMWARAWVRRTRLAPAGCFCVGEGGRGRRRLMSDESVPAAQYYENKHRPNSLMQQL